MLHCQLNFPIMPFLRCETRTGNSVLMKLGKLKRSSYTVRQRSLQQNIPLTEQYFIYE